MEKTFIDYLKEELKNIEDSGQDFDRELLHFPDLIQLLCNMLEDDSVDRQARIMINAALGYLLVPNDVVPEEVYGVYGYMDDMYVTCIVAAYLKQKYPELIESLWRRISEEDLTKTIDLCTYKSEKFLDEKNLKEKLLRFCGLSD
jgi:uncharacterized membrane protein YkvA (DUF1232 family)